MSASLLSVRFFWRSATRATLGTRLLSSIAARPTLQKPIFVSELATQNRWNRTFITSAVASMPTRPAVKKRTASKKPAKKTRSKATSKKPVAKKKAPIARKKKIVVKKKKPVVKKKVPKKRKNFCFHFCLQT